MLKGATAEPSILNVTLGSLSIGDRNNVASGNRVGGKLTSTSKYSVQSTSSDIHESRSCQMDGFLYDRPNLHYSSFHIFEELPFNARLAASFTLNYLKVISSVDSTKLDVDKNRAFRLQ